MNIIITSKMAHSLVIQLSISIVELKKNGVIIFDQLESGEYAATVENVFPLSVIDDVRAEEFVIEKEPSWVHLNRGKMSKRQRRKHNP
jgi:hypothetical protein